MVAGALSGALCLLARGQVYVTNDTGPFTVSSFSASGSLLNSALLNSGNSSLGLTNPVGIVVSGSTLYVANYGAGTVGEYTTSGALINASLVSGLYHPWGLALSGSTLYVADNGTGTVSAYTVSGASATADGSFTAITGQPQVMGVAVSGSNLYISNYASSVSNTAYTGSISVYNAATGAALNGGVPVVTGLDGPASLTASGSTVYASMVFGDSVGAFTISGTTLTNPNATFITTANAAYGVALGGSGLYVLTQNQYGGGTIGLYNPGTGAGSIIATTGLYTPFGIAAVAVPEPATGAAIAGALGLLLVAGRRRREPGLSPR